MTSDSPLPDRLLAPAAGWVARADVVVVGSGIAGLTAALRAREAGSVLLVTKARLDDGSTRWAQGGIAAALGVDDSPRHHLRDTMRAGAGLCDGDAVRVLVDEGPDAVGDLVSLGTGFDRDPGGALQLTREGGHRRDRIAHAGGDATGAEISRALLAAVRGGGIEIIEHALVLDVLLDADGGAAGVTLHVIGEGQRDGVGAVRCRAVVLATGGLGRAYAATTNPDVSTGDGVAAALRAGADVADLEFVQFHPTVLWRGRDASGQQPLVSEAVRGEGAVLVDDTGRRFMTDVHPLAELAPRDVVAKAITVRIQQTGAEHVWLDGRHLGAETWRRRFPTILRSCGEIGIDPARDVIPVVPAAHYASGGVVTDLWGRTSVPGLYACGEAACTGVHGANRLASNSLLEGLVFARRIGTDLRRGALDRPARPGRPERPASPPVGGLVASAVRPHIQRAMTEGAGVLRDREGLAAARRRLGAAGESVTTDCCTENWETTNLLTVSAALVAAADQRGETRGCHWRQDFPHRDPRWRGRIVAKLRSGRIVTEFRPLPADRRDRGTEEYRDR